MSDPWAEFRAANTDPWAQFRSKSAPADPSAGETLLDAAKGVGSGVVRGTAMLAGMGGDLNKAAGAGLDMLRERGVPVDQARAATLEAMPGWMRRAHERPAPKLGSREIMDAIDRRAGGAVAGYKPQGIFGKIGQTVGEFVPASLMGGGGLVRGALLPGTLSEGAGQIASDTWLEAPARIAGALAGGFAPKVAADVVGALGTGTGGQSVRTAFQSGVRGGETGRAFRDNMRGATPIDDVVSEARGAVRNMRAERGAQYNANMTGVRADATALDFSDIDAALAKANNIKTFKGRELSESTRAVRGEIEKKISEWKALDPKEYHTAGGLDALKQSIGDIKDSLPYNTPQRAVADQVYNSIRQTIAKQAPDYAKAMSGYQRASDSIKEIEKTLSLNPKASVDTALRKLQSVTRNNVNTNYGKRADLVEELARHGAPDLMAKLAGQSMNTWTPRGLNKIVASGVGASAYFNPASAAALPFMSPRLVGEVTHAAGRATGGITAPVRKAKRALGMNPYGEVDDTRAALLLALTASRQ